jgi:Ca2+-binding RTX toxin-like protein
MANFPTPGDDTIDGGNGADVVDALGGNDTVFGGNGADHLLGNDGDDSLSGGNGSDTLDGGAGNDTMLGGNGPDLLRGGADDDTYIITATGDTVVENSGEGIDHVVSSISYTLGANVENLTLTGTADIDGTGNELDNRIVGNSGDNVLDGLDGNDTLDGGEGADTTDGGNGDDVFIVDNAGDVVIEAEDGGNDTVFSSVSYTLTAGQEIENLTLTGNANINGTGNEFANWINGNGGMNVLDGGGGDDTVVGEGNLDTLLGGEGNDNLFGRVNHDVLDGGEGDDTLKGGIGNDTVTGGDGNDVFVFEDLGSVPVDTVTDFTAADDSLLFSGGLPNFDGAVWAGDNSLVDSDFTTIATGTDPSATDGHHFIWDSSTGVLWYDDDGAGAGAAVDIAVFNTDAGLTADDFFRII